MVPYGNRASTAMNLKEKCKNVVFADGIATLVSRKFDKNVMQLWILYGIGATPKGCELGSRRSLSITTCKFYVDEKSD